MMRRNWVSPAPLDHHESLNYPVSVNEGPGGIEGERKPSQKQGESLTIDEQKDQATLVTKPSKARQKGKRVSR
jgi:hypothetical protein